MNPPLRRLLAGLIVWTCAGEPEVRAASIFAQWNFDDATHPATAVANVGGFVGQFQATTQRTADRAGVSGAPGDYALAPGGLRVSSPDFLAALNGVFTARALSITFWIKSDSALAGYAFEGAPPVVFLAGEFRNGEVTFSVSTPLTTLAGPAPVDWQFWTFVDRGGVLEIYRGSTLLASGVRIFPPGFTPSLAELSIGLQPMPRPGGPPNLNAAIDDFTLWNGPLSPAEIAALAGRAPEPNVAVLVVSCLAIGIRRRREPLFECMSPARGS